MLRLEQMVKRMRYEPSDGYSFQRTDKLEKALAVARKAGFDRLADKLKEELRISKDRIKLIAWNKKGYLTLILPPMGEGWRSGIKTYTIKQHWFKPFELLAKIPIKSFAAQVPIEAMEQVIEHQEDFTEFHVLVIGGINEILELSPRQIIDPIIIGTWGGSEAVVLAWWGKDLESLNSFFGRQFHGCGL